MRRSWMILPCLMVLAACADAPPPAGAPQQAVRASFPPGAVTGVIRVDALDTQPLRTAELIGPDGSVTPASSLDVDANPNTIRGQASLFDPWRTSLLATNGNDPLPSGSLDPTLRSQSQVLLTISRAEIKLPDPVAYGRDWANYRIRLGFGAAGNQLDLREIPAPAPPPPATTPEG
jgi:hypothetical protein